MNITETLSQGLKREYRVVIGAGELADKFHAKLDRLSQTVRLPGFRPGKVPQGLLRKRYGDALATEMVEEVVSETASKAISEKGLRPAMQPQLLEVGKYEEGKDLEYRFAIETLPDIEPADFRGLTLERLKAAVSDEDIEAGLKRLADGNPNVVAAPEGHKAEKGDVVVIDFEGAVDGKAFAGGSGQGRHLEIGASSFVPGFEDQLIGAAVGEKREVKVTFPAAYRAQDLAGKDATFAVTIKEAKQRNTPALDDAFAGRIGAKDMADLRAQVRRQIETDFGAIARLRLKRQLLDKLAEAHNFAVPEGMVESEFTGIWREIEAQQKAGTLDEADKGKSEEQLKAEYRKIAERRVRLGLLLAEVGRRNKIEVSRDEVAKAMVNEAQRFPGQEKKVIDFYQKNPNALAQLRAPIYEDKVVDFILELAKVNERAVSSKELVEADEKEPAAAG